jgi:hypothetical protein
MTVNLATKPTLTANLRIVSGFIAALAQRVPLSQFFAALVLPFNCRSGAQELSRGVRLLSSATNLVGPAR